LTISADLGNADAQVRCGFFWSGGGGRIDYEAVAHYFKLAADQEHPEGQFCYGACLQYRTGISPDLRSAAHYFKLLADQGNADGQYCYGRCLRNGTGISRDLTSAAHYFPETQSRYLRHPTDNHEGFA
jgi:TPR repeat protein